MNYIQINKFSKVPLYIQIRDSIKNAITSGQLKNHDRLPTEEAISRFFRVSRPVVRQAYQDLLDEGLIDRTQGRGTFVNRQVLYTNLFYKTDFNGELMSKGIRPESHIINTEIVNVEDINGIGDLPAEYQTFFHLKRIRKGDGIPLFINLIYFSAHKYPDVGQWINQNMSFTKIVTEMNQIKPTSVRNELSAVILDDTIAELLDVQPNSSAMKFSNWSYDQDGNLLTFHISYFPGERHQIEMEINEETS